MADKIHKGNFVCVDCSKKQTWVYHEIKGNYMDKGFRRNVIVSDIKLNKNEVMIKSISEDRKTIIVHCVDGRCGYPNTVELEEAI